MQVIAKICMYVCMYVCIHRSIKMLCECSRVSSPCGVDHVFLVVYSCSNRSRCSCCLFIVNVDPVSTRVANKILAYTVFLDQLTVT